MAFKMKGHPLKKGNSPAKLFGIGKRFRDTGVGRAFGKIAGSGALGVGGMMASNMLGGGTGEGAAQGGAGHTHDESGAAIPLSKTGDINPKDDPKFQAAATKSHINLKKRADKLGLDITGVTSLNKLRKMVKDAEKEQNL